MRIAVVGGASAAITVAVRPVRTRDQQRDVSE